MKKWVLILLMLLLTLPGYALITIEKKPGAGTLAGHLDDINANDLELDGKIADKVSDDEFTSDWSTVTDVAPSQAALYNYLINFDADGDGLFSDEAWFPSIFDPAAPGEIGGTTAAAGAFTDLTAETLTMTSTDGENRLTFPENTSRTPATGAEEIFNEGGLMKYSENGVKKNFVTIDDTAGDGDTTVTLSADKIVEYIAGVSVAAPTIQADDPTSASDVGWYLATTSGDAFFKSAGGLFNVSAGTYTPDPDTTDPEIAIMTPAADGSWVDSATYTALAGTASDNIGVQDIYWKLESGGTYANTNVTGTTAWSVSSITLSEGLNNIYVRARDAATNAAEAIRTINVDTTDPTVGTVTPDPATHDGTGTAIEVTIASITETNEASRQYRIYDVTDDAVEEVYQSFTGLTINETLPADQHTYRFDILVTDLAGNTGSASSADIAYSAGAESTPDLQWNLDDNTSGTVVVAIYGTNGTLLGASNTSDIHAVSDGKDCFNLTVANRGFSSTASAATNAITTGVFSMGWEINGVTGINTFSRFYANSNANFIINRASTTSIRVRYGAADTTHIVPNMNDGLWHGYRLVANKGAGSYELKLYERTKASGGAWGAWSLAGTTATIGTIPASGGTHSFYSGATDAASWFGYVDTVQFWASVVEP